MQDNPRDSQFDDHLNDHKYTLPGLGDGMNRKNLPTLIERSVKWMRHRDTTYQD